MNNSDLLQNSLGEIVTLDFRTAEIFKDAGIDFCCGGKKSLEQACMEKNIPAGQLVSKIEALARRPADNAKNFSEWDLGFLSDYIVNTHHKYVLRTLPQLTGYTKKLAEVHGDRHSELREVADLFVKINEELLQHMKKEEYVLFPAIKEALKTGSPEARLKIASEISRMTGEHEFAGGAMDKINVITNSYTVPDDGCNTYRVAFALLQQFEDDLHVHVHLENNILFPKALKL
jgi:regulator of cell morphogenesis and NO signaling